MIKIEDFTTYYKFDENKYIGILFGQNVMLVNNNIYIDFNILCNNNNRIIDINNYYSNENKIYVLFNDYKLYEINISTKKIMDIYNDIKGMYMRNNVVCLLYGNNIINLKREIIINDVMVCCKIPTKSNYCCVLYADTSNNLIQLYGDTTFVKLIKYNIISINISVNDVLILSNDGTNNICNFLSLSTGKIENLIEINSDKKIIHINPLTNSSFEILYDDYTIEIIKKCRMLNDITHIKGSGITLTDSFYCAPFNEKTINLFPKYFLTRFIAFVMSIKYTENLNYIKLPKYLFFMIANYLL